jgi:hypothetical protein
MYILRQRSCFSNASHEFWLEQERATGHIETHHAARAVAVQGRSFDDAVGLIVFGSRSD